MEDVLNKTIKETEVKYNQFLESLFQDLGVDTSQDLNGLQKQIKELDINITVSKGFVDHKTDYITNNGKLIGVIEKDYTENGISIECRKIDQKR